MENKISDDVGTEVTYFATNADAEIRIHYAEILLRVLDKPIRVIRDYIHKITSTLLLVSEDAEKSVRLSLVIRIPEIYTRCRKIAVPEFDFFLDDRLLEIVLRYLHDAEPEVVSKAYVTTMTLLQKRLLTKAAIEERLCPAIVELSRATIVHPAHQVDYETNSIELMKLMAPIVGAPGTRQHLIGRFVEMCANEMHFVRKSCAEYFPVFCQVLGTEDTETLLLPVFVRLCEDAVWGVRKTAAGSLLKVALMCSLEVRRARLAPMVYRLLNDPSRWVGMIAFESLGQFISLFAQPCITGLTYTELGELNIMNAANPEFKHQCSHNLIANFAHYERIFAESLTPPADDDADDNDETRSSNNNTASTTTGLVIHQLNRTAANNNNCYLKNTGGDEAADNEPTSTNPLKQFLSPQQYDENCLSTIEKIGQRLEEFYAAHATSPADLSSQPADASAEEEVSAADSSGTSLADMSSSDASVFNGLDDDEDEEPEEDQQKQTLVEKVEAPVDNECSKLLNNINNNATTINTATLSASSPLNISNIINNNNATDDATSTEQPQLATNTARLQANAADDDDDDAATRTPLSLPTPPPPTTTTPTAVAAAAAPSHNNHNHNHTRKHSKSQRKSRSKAVAAAAAAAAATAAAAASAAAAAAADAAKADVSSSTTTTTTTTLTNETVQQLPGDETSDCNDSTPSQTPSPPAPLLRKNTPADLPQIIKQAIDTTTTKTEAGGRARRGPAAALNIALANQPPPPPETPAIEASPQQALDFTDPAPAPASLATAPTTRVDEQLLAAGDYDNSQENAPAPIDLLQMMGRRDNEGLQESSPPSTPPQLDDDPADLQTEFASVHYWHLEPAQPVGWEAELELAAATAKADYVLRLKVENGEDLDEDDENDNNDDEDDDDEDDDEDDDDDDDDGYDNTQSPLLSHIFQSVTINDIYSESSKGQSQVHARNSVGGGMRGGNNNSGGGGGNNDPQSDNSANNVDSGWSKALAALQPPEATTAAAVDVNADAGLLDSSALNKPYVQPVVPGYLVRYYVSMVGFNDGLMNMHCAYNFPAVVLTLGRPHWHLAQRLLKLLCDDIQWKIRKTVAVFIYQIALIIGRELAGRDLVPIFMGFFKDLDEVKIEALRNLTNFLRVIDIRHHHQIVFRLGSCLNNYANNYANWRFREELAQQVLNLIEVYGNVYNADGMTFLVGIAINLLSDEVCSVRDIAQNAIVATFKICAPCDTGDLISLLTDEFAGSTFWRKRQIYISICYKLIAEHAITDELFESRLLGSLLPLANDAVPNIRLNVGKLLSRMLLHHEYYAMRPVHERIAQIVALLREDQDRDVRFMAADVDDPPNDSSTTSSSSSGSGNDASNDVSTTISDTANIAGSDSSSSVAAVAVDAAEEVVVDIVSASSPIAMPPASEMW